MDKKLEALLDSAKARIGKKNHKQEEPQSAEDIVKAIPKLESLIKMSDSERAPATQLKAIPLRNVKKEKPDTAGKQWFDLGKPEMTPELKRDLQLLKMRHVLDPKRFYKKEDEQAKYFAVGTIQSDSTEFFSNRLTKKQRKQTMAEEILRTRSDYFNTKYREIQKAKTSDRRKHQKKLRDMRS